MNTLNNVTLNSVNLIEERLQLLQKELADIEKEYGPLRIEKPVESKLLAQRYQELPSIQPEPAKIIVVKPQIKEEYLRTLQYVPDIMTEYNTDLQEPQYVDEISEINVPPRPIFDNFLVYSFLERKNKNLK